MSSAWQLYLVSGILSFLIAAIARHEVIGLIERAGFTRPNFKGEEIPLASGVIFFLTSIPVAVVLFLLGPGFEEEYGLLFLFSLAAATMLGLMDDFWGSRDVTGLKGHLTCLVRGRLTTGALKALGGGTLGLVAGVVVDRGWGVAVTALLVALSINAINLLDLRPGRAGKGFLIGAVVLLAVGWGHPALAVVTAVAGSLIALLPLDLRARTMMGDAGSNALGVTLGLAAAEVLDFYGRMAYLLLLVGFHLFTERYSLTEIIEKNRLLHFLDMLGRKK